MSVIFGWLVMLQTYGDLVRFWVFFFSFFFCSCLFFTSFLAVLHLLQAQRSVISTPPKHAEQDCRSATLLRTRGYRIHMHAYYNKT